MEALGNGAIRCRHLGDLREHAAFLVRESRRTSFRLRCDLCRRLGVLHWMFPPLRVSMGTTLMLGCLPRRWRLQLEPPKRKSVAVRVDEIRVPAAVGVNDRLLFHELDTE